MIYRFRAGIYTEGGRAFIKIPFNVWEVCKLRDEIRGKVVLDNDIIDCRLLPKDKGNYEIHIEDEEAVKAAVGVTHKILLHINGSLIRMDQDSPYSFENPIRRIDSMQVIIQPLSVTLFII